MAFRHTARRLTCIVASICLPSIAAAQVPAAEYATRRATLMAPIDSGVIVAFGQVVPPTFWPPFFQHSDFLYLTGFSEPAAALVIVKRNGSVSEMMFVPPRDQLTERFDGVRHGAEELEKSIGIPGRLDAQLQPTIDSLAGLGLPFYIVADFYSEDATVEDLVTRGQNFVARVRQAHPYLIMHPLNEAVGRLRAKKSVAELALLRRAVDFSTRAHNEAMKATAAGCGEWEIQALMEGIFRRMGGDRPGYSSIVASGPNALVLHYRQASRVMRDGELILIDAGTSFDHYSADVTRTYPVNGRFTPAQRDIYQLVRDLQDAFVEAITTGATENTASAAARAVANRGLFRLGLIESDSARFDGPAWMPWCGEKGCNQRWLYVHHGYGGHGIGLDVHDWVQYDNGGPFLVGDVFTVEPGLYFSESFMRSLPDTPRNRAMLASIGPAFERYKGIGVRIEDDYAITETGLEWLSKDSPREISEIESLMRSQGPALPGGGSCGGPST